MDRNKITDFTISLYKFEIEVSKERGNVKHTYYSVPREIIKWFINCSKEPSLKDFEDKLRDHQQRQEKKSNDVVCCGNSFWDS